MVNRTANLITGAPDLFWNHLSNDWVVHRLRRGIPGAVGHELCPVMRNFFNGFSQDLFLDYLFVQVQNHLIVRSKLAFQFLQLLFGLTDSHVRRSGKPLAPNHLLPTFFKREGSHFLTGASTAHTNHIFLVEECQDPWEIATRCMKLWTFLGRFNLIRLSWQLFPSVLCSISLRVHKCWEHLNLWYDV